MQLNTTTNQQNLSNQFSYAVWRLEMWNKGYGSYNDIDRKVKESKLIPGKIYPAVEAHLNETKTL